MQIPIGSSNYHCRRHFLAGILLACIVLSAGCNGSHTQTTASPPPQVVHFVPNSHSFWSNPNNWTTPFGPAYADILLAPTNFVPCRGGPYALCYYSGPSSGPEDLSCTTTSNGKYANCNCYDIPYGVYFVDINSILNYHVLQKTIAACGSDGANCQTLNSAPVCQAVNDGTLIPDAKLFSTFSFDCVPTDGIGLTDCAQEPYAGCMTAPCHSTGQSGIVSCSCPVFDGPYQVGQNDEDCSLGGDQVWSAAYTVPSPTPTATPGATDGGAGGSSNTGTSPMPAACIPDAPGGFGCPLYDPGQTVLPPDSGVNCALVCKEYETCTQKKEIQAGFTCDATLCTDECNDRDLVQTACQGLTGCDISEIVKAETAAQCSCCASQLCNCNPTATTNAEISALNQQQRGRGITPQCDVNGTLCGTP
ncbi:MAG: hypothetical protein ACREQI_06920 [Candidatus Binataceae bacterium]